MEYKIDETLRYGPDFRPLTVGELRDFLEIFDPETPIMPSCYGVFRYAIDGECNGLIQMA